MAKILTKDIENAIMGVNFPAKKHEILIKPKKIKLI